MALVPFPVTPVVVIDCEASGALIRDLKGPVTEGDVLFGFGVAVGYLDPTTRVPVISRIWSVGIIPTWFTTFPSTTAEWRDVWEKHRMEKMCFDEFWARGSTPDGISDNLKALFTLLYPGRRDQTVVSSYPEAAAKLNDILGQIETASPTGSYILACDCIPFDTPALSMLLGQNGFHWLSQRRNGKYRWHGTVDQDSLLRRGSALHPKNDAIDARKASLRAAAAAAAEPLGLAPHHPAYDAFTVLHAVLADSA
jgi:hypothetical protein